MATVVCRQPDVTIPNDPLRYVPTTVPGVRLPSILLSDGTAVFDRLGRWFTLISCGVPTSRALVTAAGRRGVPLDLLQLDAPEAVDVYGRGMLLVRPDQHIAWRGLRCDDPALADAIFSRVLAVPL